MTDTKIDGTAVAGIVRDVNEKLSMWQASDDVNPQLFKLIMENTDFTDCTTTLDSMIKFYCRLYIHAIGPLEDDNMNLQKEIGRLIVEWDDQKRKNTTLQKEVDALREQVQGTSTTEAE